jgi:hypothetical protein
MPHNHLVPLPDHLGGLFLLLIGFSWGFVVKLGFGIVLIPEVRVRNSGVGG